VSVKIKRKTCLAHDKVNIVYSACGKGEPALFFIHGGLAERTFWDKQLEAFCTNHRVVALDLPGHGESGSNRENWGLPEFGADVKAVADAEKLDNLILFGNSLDGPVAVEAAYKMFLGMSGYDNAAPVRKLTVPLRAINGDIYPTDVEGVRKIKPDFDAIIMEHMGHYPMLERPEEFNRYIASVIAELTR